MKKLIACLLIGLQFNCMSADPKLTESNINDNTFKWNYDEFIKYDSDNLLITIYPSQVQDNIFNDLYYKYAVDGDVAAVKYLSENYEICFVVVYNKNKKECNFDLTKLQINNHKRSFKFISPLDMPSKIKRLNAKGITKNVYNTIVIIAITAAIIALCQKSNSIPNLNLPINITPNSNDSTKKEPNDYQKYGIFSSFFHKTNYHYNDCIMDNNIVLPLSTKEGVVFIKKGCFKNKDLQLNYQ